MSPHMIVALYLGGIAAGVLAGVIAYEIRDARDVIRRAPVPPRVVPSNVRKIETAPRVIGRRSS